MRCSCRSRCSSWEQLPRNATGKLPQQALQSFADRQSPPRRISMMMQSALCISPDHPAFAGHFPKFPVLPGAILLDEIIKAIESARGIEIRHWHIASAKFLGPVRPHDSLVLEHDAPKQGLIRFTIRVANRKVAGGMLLQEPKT